MGSNPPLFYSTLHGNTCMITLEISFKGYSIKEATLSVIRVVVNGATGKMGMETMAALCREPDLEPVGAVCHRDRGGVLVLPDGSEIPLSIDLEFILSSTDPSVVVDFTNSTVCMASVPTITKHSVNMVLGASGLTDANLEMLDHEAHERDIGIVVAPNFALGAVILKKLAEQAAPFFDYLDIIEAHHEAKIDAPSGFAMALAQSLGNHKEFIRNETSKENLPNTRGGEYNGITVHSIRMPGRSAHHEVIMGAPGQTISLRHDTLGRDCYMPGVMRCIREVVKNPGLVVGLENVLGL